MLGQLFSPGVEFLGVADIRKHGGEASRRQHLAQSKGVVVVCSSVVGDDQPGAHEPAFSLPAAGSALCIRLKLLAVDWTCGAMTT